MEEIEEIRKALTPILEGKITGDDEVYSIISKTNDRLSCLKRRWETAVESLTPTKRRAPQIFAEVMAEWQKKYSEEIFAMISMFKDKKTFNIPKKDPISAIQLTVAFIFRALEVKYNVFFMEDDDWYIVNYQECKTMLVDQTDFKTRWTRRLYCADDYDASDPLCKALVKLELHYSVMLQKMAHEDKIFKPL